MFLCINCNGNLQSLQSHYHVCISKAKRRAPAYSRVMTFDIRFLTHIQNHALNLFITSSLFRLGLSYHFFCYPTYFHTRYILKSCLFKISYTLRMPPQKFTSKLNREHSCANFCNLKLLMILLRPGSAGVGAATDSRQLLDSRVHSSLVGRTLEYATPG